MYERGKVVHIFPFFHSHTQHGNNREAKWLEKEVGRGKCIVYRSYVRARSTYVVYEVGGLDYWYSSIRPSTDIIL